MQPDQITKQHAKQVLQRNQQTCRNGDQHTEFSSCPLDHLHTEAKTYAQEEQVLTQILHNCCVKRQGNDSTPFQKRYKNGKDQT